jgi:hypothetical protein
VSKLRHSCQLLRLDPYFLLSFEKTLPFETPEELAVVAKQIIDLFPKELLPDLFRFTTEHVLKPEYSYSKEFLIGLDVVILGIEARMGC